MANIEHELSQMKTAIYGTDMRKAIYDAMNKVNNDVTEGVVRLDAEQTLTESEKTNVIEKIGAVDINNFDNLKLNLTNRWIVYEHGGIYVSNESIVYTNASNRLHVKPVNFNGQIAMISANDGYQINTIRIENGIAIDTNVTAVNSNIRWLIGYKDADYAFLIRKTNNESITVEEAYRNTKIEVYTHKTDMIGNGLKREDVILAANWSINAGETEYSYVSNRASSAPILIPKSGLKISVNPDKYIENSALSFRVMCFNLQNDGLHLDTQNEDLYGVSQYAYSSTDSVYIPYIENAYIVILTGQYNSNPDNLKNAIYIYSQENAINGVNGKLLGLHPMRVYLKNGVPVISWGNKTAIVNTTRYLGGALWLKYINSITVSPKYSVVANVYKLNDDDTVTLMDSFYTMEYGNTIGKVAGVQYIDCSGYNFDGYVLFAIQNTIQFDINLGLQGEAYKKHRGLGVMSKYLDVYNNVYVDYKNAYQCSIEPGIPETTFENINDFINYTYPHRLHSYYVHEWEKENKKHYFDDTYDASPAFYSGGFNANSLFLNVTGKSYYTGMQNINSRCYQFVRDSEHIGSTDYGRIGYGLTCTNFVAILLGLKENYPSSTMALAPTYKFDVIKDNWDYRKDMDLVKPGDILVEYLYKPSGEGDSTDAHTMMVYEKKYINGHLECVILIEAGYPYTRFTCLYNDKYFPLFEEQKMGNFQTIRRLDDYHYLRRIKPEYLKSLKKVYDLSRNYKVGTLMCDRGSDSIYCVNPVDSEDPTLGMELEQPELVITVTDEQANSIMLYKDGTLIDAISIGSREKNGYRVVDIRNYVTEQGLYTLKTDTSDDVQERFWVQAPVFFGLEEIKDENENSDNNEVLYRIAHIPNPDKLRYLAITYNKVFESEGDSQSAIQYLIITPEELEQDISEVGKPWDETWGRYIVPAIAFDDAIFNYIMPVYETDYGTYQLRLRQLSNNPDVDKIITVSCEYQFKA